MNEEWKAAIRKKRNFGKKFSKDRTTAYGLSESALNLMKSYFQGR